MESLGNFPYDKQENCILSYFTEAQHDENHLNCVSPMDAFMAKRKKKKTLFSDFAEETSVVKHFYTVAFFSTHFHIPPPPPQKRFSCLPFLLLYETQNMASLLIPEI